MKKPVLLVLAEALVCYTVVAVSEFDGTFEEVKKGKEIWFSWETSVLEVQTYGAGNLNDKNMQIELEFGLGRQSEPSVLKISLRPNNTAKIEYEGDSQKYSIPTTISRVWWTFRKDKNSSLICVDYGNYLAASLSINDEDEIDRLWFGQKDTASEYYRVIYFDDRGKILNCNRSYFTNY